MHVYVYSIVSNVQMSINDVPQNYDKPANCELNSASRCIYSRNYSNVSTLSMKKNLSFLIKDCNEFRCEAKFTNGSWRYEILSRLFICRDNGIESILH